MTRSRARFGTAALLLLALLGLLALLYDFQGSPGGPAPKRDQEQSLEAVTIEPRLRGFRGDDADGANRRPSRSVQVEDPAVPVPPEIRLVVRAAADEAPIPGATAFLSQGEHDIVPIAAAFVADDQGQVILRGDGARFVNVHANGYLPSQLLLAAPARDQTLTAYLEQGTAVRGRVLTASDDPVSDAEVVVFGMDNQPATLHRDRQLCVYAGTRAVAVRVRTDANGRFVATGLTGLRTGGDLGARAWKSMWAPWPPMHRLSDGEASGVDEVVLRLDPLYGLRIVVENGASGVADAIRWEATYGGSRGVVSHPKSLRRCFSPADRADGAGEDRILVEKYLRGAGGPIEVDAQIKSLRWEVAKLKLRLQPGEMLVRRVRLVPRPVPIRVVRFAASFEGGRAYTGPLHLQIQRLGDPPARLVRLVFRDGASEETCQLPIGTYLVFPEGDRHRNPWWNPAGPNQRFELEEAAPDKEGELTLELALRGGGFRLDVRKPDGAPVRGFSAGGSGGEGGHRAFWDLIAMADERSGDPGSGVLWFPPGPTALCAEFPGLGHGVVDVTAPSDGSVRSVRLVLGTRTAEDGASR